MSINVETLNNKTICRGCDKMVSRAGNAIFLFGVLGIITGITFMIIGERGGIDVVYSEIIAKVGSWGGAGALIVGRSLTEWQEWQHNDENCSN